MSSPTNSIFAYDSNHNLVVRPTDPEARLDELERRVATLEREVTKLPDAAAARVSRELSAAVQALRTDRG